MSTDQLTCWSSWSVWFPADKGRDSLVLQFSREPGGLRSAETQKPRAENSYCEKTRPEHCWVYTVIILTAAEHCPLKKICCYYKVKSCDKEQIRVPVKNNMRRMRSNYEVIMTQTAKKHWLKVSSSSESSWRFSLNSQGWIWKHWWKLTVWRQTLTQGGTNLFSEGWNNLQYVNGVNKNTLNHLLCHYLF